jgi:hypothetical protein
LKAFPVSVGAIHWLVAFICTSYMVSGLISIDLAQMTYKKFHHFPDALCSFAFEITEIMKEPTIRFMRGGFFHNLGRSNFSFSVCLTDFLTLGQWLPCGFSARPFAP